MVCERRQHRTLLAGLLALSLLLTPALASAYGGGGGGGGDVGGGVGGGTTTTNIEPWTQAELQAIFSTTSAQQRSTLVQAFAGSTISRRDLLNIRQVFLNQNADAANNEAAMLNACVKTLEILDAMGELTQDGLAFVPGVGWVTSAALSGARAGAEGYRDGLSTGDIVKGVVISTTSSALVSKFSPLDADRAFQTARAGINVARNALTEQIKSRALGIVQRNITRYGIKKYVEGEAETALGQGMEALADYMGAPNTAQQPEYVADPYYDPMKSAPSTPVAGGTPQL